MIIFHVVVHKFSINLVSPCFLFRMQHSGRRRVVAAAALRKAMPSSLEGPSSTQAPTQTSGGSAAADSPWGGCLPPMWPGLLGRGRGTRAVAIAEEHESIPPSEAPTRGSSPQSRTATAEDSPHSRAWVCGFELFPSGPRGVI